MFALEGPFAAAAAAGAIQGILDWRNSRRFFYQRLRRRQWEFSVLRRLRRVAPGVTLKAALQRLQEWCGGVQDDAALAQWCEEHAAVIEERVQTVWKVWGRWAAGSPGGKGGLAWGASTSNAKSRKSPICPDNSSFVFGVEVPTHPDICRHIPTIPTTV